MSRANLILAAAALLLVGGCTRLFESDGTPESELVRKWLSEDPGRPSALLEPGAQLVMSDHGLTLTQGHLRSFGPDRRPGCKRSTLKRRGSTVVASWSCPAGTDPAFRTVYFHVRNGRIASANYMEAYQAAAKPTD